MMSQAMLRAMTGIGLGGLLLGGLAALMTGSAAVTLAASVAGGLGAILLQGEGDRAPQGRSAVGRHAAEPFPSPHGLPVGAGRTLLEELPLGVLLVDADSRVQYINPVARALFGQHTAGAFHAASLRAPKLLTAIEEIGAQGEPGTVELSLMRGGEIRLRAQVRPLAPEAEVATTGPAGRAPVLIVIEDMTRSWRVQELYRDFVANASHELKTPLASIIGFIETLQGHARADPEAAARFLGLMETQAHRMTRLIEDMLSLSRIEQNERVMPRTPQPLHDILEETVAAMRPLAQAAGVTLSAEMPRVPATVLGSREELAQVFQNLVDNGIKYADRGDSVIVESAFSDDRTEVRIAVRDTGPGIARTHLPRLTERFYRVSAPSSRARGGTGLGLAIVKHVLTRHRGQLLIESEEGAGSCFTVALPLADQASAPPSAVATVT